MQYIKGCHILNRSFSSQFCVAKSSRKKFIQKLHSDDVQWHHSVLFILLRGHNNVSVWRWRTDGFCCNTVLLTSNFYITLQEHINLVGSQPDVLFIIYFLKWNIIFSKIEAQKFSVTYMMYLTPKKFVVCIQKYRTKRGTLEKTTSSVFLNMNHTKIIFARHHKNYRNPFVL